MKLFSSSPQPSSSPTSFRLHISLYYFLLYLVFENVKGRVGTQNTKEIEEGAEVEGHMETEKKNETIRKWQLIMHKE